MTDDFLVKTHEGADVPYAVDPATGAHRLLLALPTPAAHAMKAAVPTWLGRGLPEMTLAEIRSEVRGLARDDAAARARALNLSVTRAVASAGVKIDRVRAEVPVLDQGQVGACLPHAFSSACMLAKAVAGDPFVDLDPFFLYTLIDNGVDQGSNAGDAVEALTTVGVCPRGIVPYGTVRPKGYSPEALAAAKRCLLRDAVQIQGYKQFLIAILLDYAVPFDVYAGNFTATGPDGVCAYRQGPTNHEVLAAEQIVSVNGMLLPGGRNSWGTTWGVSGRCLWLPQHCDDAETAFAVRFVSADPDDAGALPPL